LSISCAFLAADHENYPEIIVASIGNRPRDFRNQLGLSFWNFLSHNYFQCTYVSPTVRV